MTVSFKITEKGKKNVDSVGKGHLQRMMQALVEKGELELDELVAIVKRHSEGEPRSVASWYLSRAADVQFVKRIAK